MFIFTTKASAVRRAFLLLVLLLAACAAVVLLYRRSIAPDGASIRAEDNAARVAYLASLGWEVDAEPLEALRLTLPDTLEEPYRSYNELQIRQGFDLTPYLGKTLERYAYRARNYPGRPDGCQLDLYVRDGVIVAGDVLCTGADGFIDVLSFPT